ncbi:MAG: hypothetical protein ACW976_06780 [Candidatus Ranarchaeia archaeon]|jgi:hypothetical protein
MYNKFGTMPNDVYDEVKAHFSSVKDVVVLSGSGAQGLKYGKKLFAMFTKGAILIRLPPIRVNEVIASGEGLPHDPGTGTPMKNMVLIPAKNKALWIQMCEEAKSHMA